MPHGKLSVVVDSASNIKDPGIGGKRGSYCILTCGSQVLRSRTVEGCGRHPLFKTSFEFEIDRSTNELKVCVYNERGSSREGELVGYCTLIFKQVFYYGHKLPLTSYPMLLPSGNSAAQINMFLNFKMRPSPKTQTKPVVPLEHCSRPPVITQNSLLGSKKSLSIGATIALKMSTLVTDNPGQNHCSWRITQQARIVATCLEVLVAFTKNPLAAFLGLVIQVRALLKC